MKTKSLICKTFSGQHYIWKFVPISDWYVFKIQLTLNMRHQVIFKLFCFRWNVRLFEFLQFKERSKYRWFLRCRLLRLGMSDLLMHKEKTWTHIVLSEVDFGICFILNVSVKTDVSSVAREYLQNVGQ